MMNRTTKQMEQSVKKITARINRPAADAADADSTSESSGSSDNDTTDNTQDFQQGED